MSENEPLFEVKGLEVEFETDSAPARAVRGVDFTVNRGETVALVGESGCGKSVTALAAMGLLPGSARVRGSVRLGGKELVGLPEADLRRVRGGEIAMVFQEPMTSLNPVFRIGQQIAEVLRLHRGSDERAARREAIELLARVGIPLPERRVDQYPHELSGGMKQRVMIAMAIAGRPRLLIADEPTTALDVTIQAQILELLQSLRRDHDMAMLMITHDLGIVAHFAERVNVMYAGKLVEASRVVDLFDDPLHPYTRALLGALPRPGRSRERLEAIPGRVPPPDRLPPGCPFAPRCKLSMPVCAERMPELAERAPEHRAACFALDEPPAAGT